MESLLEMGFQQSSTICCLFYKIYPDGSQLFFLNCVDDMLYFRTSSTLVAQFDADLSSHFNLEKLGQAYWYLATCITQHANFNITIDQTKCCKSIIYHFSDSAGCKNNLQTHTTTWFHTNN